MAMQRKEISYPRLLWRMGALWALFPVVFAVTFGTIGVLSLQEARLLDRHGIDGMAIIEDKFTRTRRDSEGRTTTDHYLAYTFTPEGSLPLSAQDTVGRNLYMQVRVGDDVPIRYVPHRPEVHEIDPGSAKVLGWIFGGIGGLAALISVGVAVWMWQRKQSVLRAARQGEVRQARVTGLRRTNVTKNNHPMYVLQWVDAAGDGGVSRMRAQGDFADHPEGSVIVVYVDPKTGRSWWEEDF